MSWAIGEKSYSQRRACGLIGLDAQLFFNSHLMVRHLSMLSSWNRSGSDPHD